MFNFLVVFDCCDFIYIKQNNFEKLITIYLHDVNDYYKVVFQMCLLLLEDIHLLILKYKIQNENYIK